MPQIKEKLVESTAHSQSLFDAPAFRLYLVVHIEVKTMCWGASSPHQHSPQAFKHVQSQLLGLCIVSVFHSYVVQGKTSLLCTE